MTLNSGDCGCAVISDYAMMMNIMLLMCFSRWACEDLPEMKTALENNILSDFNPRSYESMKDMCDRFNRAIDSVVALVNIFIITYFFAGFVLVLFPVIFSFAAYLFWMARS